MAYSRKKYVAERYGIWQWFIRDPHTGLAYRENGKVIFINSKAKLEAKLAELNGEADNINPDNGPGKGGK